MPALQKFEVGGREPFLNAYKGRYWINICTENPYLTAKETAHYVGQSWDISYSESDITQLLCRIGYVYKKPKQLPCKANTEKQRAFVECHEELKEKFGAILVGSA